MIAKWGYTHLPESVDQSADHPGNRSEKLQDEVAELNKRVKALQKELAEVKELEAKLAELEPQEEEKAEEEQAAQ